MSDVRQAAPALAQIPAQPSELRAWLAACAVCLAGIAVLVAVLTGAVGRTAAVSPPAVLVPAPTPVPSSASAASALGAAAPTARSRGSRIARARGNASPAGATSFEQTPALGTPEVPISGRWMEGFYPIYETAQGTFGVSWLLLASIHMQETAFSTAPSTYHGLNFAHCCGGPMQFNVTNGPVSTWDLVASSYMYAPRPSAYDHRTATHPSIYDDFDAIMAAAHLLSADGAGYALDGSAWVAAYDYYGASIAGVRYADEVLARAIGWSQHGFCINCGVQAGMLEAVHAAWGAPVLAQLQAAERSTQVRAQAHARRRSRGR